MPKNLNEIADRFHVLSFLTHCYSYCYHKNLKFVNAVIKNNVPTTIGLSVQQTVKFVAGCHYKFQGSSGPP